MSLGPIPRSAILAYAAEFNMSKDEAAQFLDIIRAVDVEYMRSSHSKTKTKGKQVERDAEAVSINDTTGARDVLSRLRARSSAVKGKQKPNGKP